MRERIVLKGVELPVEVNTASNQRVVLNKRPGAKGRQFAPVGEVPPDEEEPSVRESDAWEAHEVLPGVEVRVRPGIKVAIQPVGTPEVPVFLITPGQAVGVQPASAGMVQTVYAGLVPVLALLAKPVAKAIGKALGKKGRNRRRAAEVDEDEDDDQLRPGDVTEINGSRYTCAGFDQSGAILVDSDGHRVEV